MHYCNHPWLTLEALAIKTLSKQCSSYSLLSNVQAISFPRFFFLLMLLFLVCCFPFLQRGLKCGPFVWVMLICWGNECINFISTWPQSNNYQSRCVTSNHVKICQLIIKILFWGTWIWHESPREKKREEKVNAFQWPRLGACCWTQWGWLWHCGPTGTIFACWQLTFWTNYRK